MPLPALSRWRTWIPPLPRPDSGLGEINLAGTIALSRGTGHSRMRLFGQWALVYLVAGEGLYRDERGTEMPVTAGDWILVFPEVAHSYGPRAGGLWNEVYVGFRGPVFEAWRDAGYFHPSRPVGRWLPVREGAARFAEFFRTAEKRACTATEAVCAWQLLLAGIFQPMGTVSPNRPSWLGKALDLLEQSSPVSKPPLREIAGACGMGYESFRKKFEEALGEPPGQYALGRRVERARHLIALHRLTNKELAELLGFYDEFHFSKTFTRLTGMTPRQYRRKNLAGE